MAVVRLIIWKRRRFAYSKSEWVTHTPQKKVRFVLRKSSGARRAKAYPNEAPLKIIWEELQTVSSEETLMRLSERWTIFREINRLKTRQRPAIPRSLATLEITDPYDNTLDGGRFLQFDSGADDPDRLLIFYTDYGLQKLCDSRTLFCDGTFKTAPRLFVQLYTIHGMIINHVSLWFMSWPSGKMRPLTPNCLITWKCIPLHCGLSWSQKPLFATLNWSL